MKALDALARDYTETAVKVIVDVMNDPLAEHRDRLKAAYSILDRGYGKLNQAIIAVPGGRQIAALLATKSDEELLALLNSHQLPRLAPIEAQFTEVVPAGTSDPLLS